MEPPSIENALQNLRSPVTGVGKFLLRRWIVPKARDAVGQREWGKLGAFLKIAQIFKLLSFFSNDFNELN